MMMKCESMTNIHPKYGGRMTLPSSSCDLLIYLFTVLLLFRSLRGTFDNVNKHV